MKEDKGLFRILLVDDEPYVREGLRELIDWERYGFTLCGEAADGGEALEMIERLRPHLVITDVRMPETDGLELIRRALQERKAECKFIILSGYGEFKYAQTAIRYNVRKYILKPIEEEELTEALTELHAEIRGDMERQGEKLAGIRSQADTAIRKLMKGEISGDAASFAAGQLGCAGPMLFVTIEVLNMRQWLSEMDYEEIQSGLADIERSILGVTGRENALSVLKEEPSLFHLLVTQSMLGRNQNSVPMLCRNLHNVISLGGKYKTVVYAGKTVEGLKQLRDSFDSCVYARERNFFDRRDGVILYDDVKDRQFHYNFSGEPAYVSLRNTVESGKKDCVGNLVGELFLSMHQKELAPEVVRACVVSFMLDVVKAISGQNGDADGLFTRFSMSGLQTMPADELRETLRAFCLSGAEYIRGLKEVGSRGIMADIEAFIRHNYKSDINLKSVAEHFFIHPVYLGHQFKKKYGLYLNDYINNLRIDEASRMLATTDWKVHEIARKVGFTDPDYFVRKFKKSKGASPSQFRSRAE
jgi:two-component system response regulator YesN